jgi:myo-inositol-1(or 4)-monophosphatase
MAEVTPSELLSLAVAAAEEAGALLSGALAAGRFEVGTKSTSTDMVTEMDRASEALILRRLLEARPHDAVLAEEGGAREGSSGVRWVVDPLDGTTNYLYGFPAFAVSIAAELDGRVVAGVVVDPVHGEVFRALAGGGAYRGEQRLRVRQPPPLRHALIGTGFGYHPARRAEQARVLATVLPEVRDIRRAGSAALDLCWVAAGRLDGFFERGLKPWDRAAGALVAAEAGAWVGDLAGGPPSDAMTIAAPPRLAEALRELLARAGAA